MVKWKYVGDGSFVPGIPARDLTDEESKEYDEQIILACNLYEKVVTKSKSKDKEKDEE
jgi:hypothetical protein